MNLVCKFFREYLISVKESRSAMELLKGDYLYLPCGKNLHTTDRVVSCNEIQWVLWERIDKYTLVLRSLTSSLAIFLKHLKSDVLFLQVLYNIINFCVWVNTTRTIFQHIWSNIWADIPSCNYFLLSHTNFCPNIGRFSSFS